MSVNQANPIKSRLIAVAIGLVMALVALFANRLGLSTKAGIGPAKLILLLFGISVLVAGALPPKSGIKQTYLKFLLAAASCYSAFLIAEAALTYRSGIKIRAHAGATDSLRGMYTAAEPMGYDLSPDWTGVFDDGIVQANISINSCGARDDEPTSEETMRKILLLGDSFAFGYCLDQQDTIDKQIESLTNGELDAYNLGVGGYGSGETLGKLQVADSWKGTDVFYLFFHNDLRDDNAKLGTKTVYEGYVVPKYKPDGTRYSVQEYQARLRNRNTPPPSELRVLAQQLKEIITLARIRTRASHVLGSDDGLVDGGEDRYHSDFVDYAVEHTKRMSRLTEERGMRFHVVIVPSRRETSFRRYASVTASYIEGIRGEGINVIELIDTLTSDCYHDHDIHFNPIGAEVTAKAIVASLPSAP